MVSKEDKKLLVKLFILEDMLEYIEEWGLPRGYRTYSINANLAAHILNKNGVEISKRSVSRNICSFFDELSVYYYRPSKLGSYRIERLTKKKVENYIKKVVEKCGKSKILEYLSNYSSAFPHLLSELSSKN